MPKIADVPKTLGRKKLAALNIQLPVLPTTSGGSLPKMSDLTELRYKVAQGVMKPEELERKEKIATEVWVREQTKLGLSVLVDGEMQRSDLVSYFARGIDGFETGGTVRIYGNRYYRRPIVKAKLAWRKGISVDMWQYAQRMTHNPLKAVVTGPYTLMDWSFNEYYPTREALLADLVPIVKKEVALLAETGAKMIQIDEPAASLTDFPLLADAFSEIVKGLKSYVTLHVCYADLRVLWPELRRLPADNFLLEMTNSQFSALPVLKKHPTDKDITIGVIDCHTHEVETPRQVSDRVKLALKVVPRDRLWLSSDCGLKSRTADEASAKLFTMVQAVTKIRNKG
jgi:5-methyltetrahydropteroyltriglutamate--homocysteine methyltransferase